MKGRITLTLKVVTQTHSYVRRLMRGHCQSRLIFDILPQPQSGRLRMREGTLLTRLER